MGIKASKVDMGDNCACVVQNIQWIDDQNCQKQSRPFEMMSTKEDQKFVLEVLLQLTHSKVAQQLYHVNGKANRAPQLECSSIGREFENNDIVKRVFQYNTNNATKRAGNGIPAVGETAANEEPTEGFVILNLLHTVKVFAISSGKSLWVPSHWCFNHDLISRSELVVLAELFFKMMEQCCGTHIWTKQVQSAWSRVFWDIVAAISAFHPDL